jgi:intracellular multiplication protein IcmL
MQKNATEESATELIQLRNTFYRDSYQRILIALFIMLLVSVGLISVVFFQLTHRPIPQYFAISSDGKLVKLEPLSEPAVSNSVLLQWAVDAATAAYSYDFVNYRSSLQSAQNKFTPDGWNNFESALRGTRILETVISKKLIVSAIATGAPTIEEQGMLEGAYSWRVTLPLLVTYQSSTELTQQPLIISMIISRVPIVNYPDGIAIVSFVTTEGKIS